MTDHNIDWESIVKHLAENQRMLEKHEPSEEETKRILHQRAMELARELPTAQAMDTLQIIGFELGQEHYGVEARHARRVSESKSIVQLPGTPAFVAGIINDHGVLVCVINLKIFFGLAEAEKSQSGKILIIRHGDIELGILADRITAIETVQADTLQTSLSSLTGTRAEFLLGITRARQIILNVSNLLNHKDLIVNDYV